MLIETRAETSATRACLQRATPASPLRGAALILVASLLAWVGGLSGCAEDPASLKLSISTPGEDQSIGVGETVEFEATVKGGESPVSVEWNFDSTGVGGADPETSTEKSPGAVTFSAVGDYVVTVQAEDDALQTEEDTVTVTASYRTYVTSFEAVSGDEMVSLSWTAPTHPDYGYYVVRRDTADFPQDIDGGSAVYDGSDTSHDDTDPALANETEYFYAAFACKDDSFGACGVGVNKSSTPADTVAPAKPTAFMVTAIGTVTATLTWIDPTDTDLDKIAVRYATGYYPLSATDGFQACLDVAKTVQTCSVVGLTAGTTYYFAAFAYDEVPNYSKGARVMDETVP